MKDVQAFIAFNKAAYTVFKAIAKDIESQQVTWQLKAAEAGVLPGDYRPFIVAYVAETAFEAGPLKDRGDGKPETNDEFLARVTPRPSQRGGLTFVKDSTEDSRVKRILSVLNGTAAIKAEKRKEAAKAGKAEKAEKAGDPLTVALEAFAALSAAQRKAFLAVVAK